MTDELPRITALSTTVPDHDIHAAFVEWATGKLQSNAEQAIFRRMARKSGIAHRWSVLPKAPDEGSPVSPGGFYATPVLPGTAERMQVYAKSAMRLGLRAVKGLGSAFQPERITHLVVASCTGFVAPGIDQLLARDLGLSPTVERVLVGFMGCYAAVTALRTARHIVRSDPAACVLVVTVELSTLHLQDTTEIEGLLAMLHFGDGAAAALIEAQGSGLALGEGRSLALPGTESLIRWDIGDHGFAMHLSGEVPHRIELALKDSAIRQSLLQGAMPDHWAIHAGGRTILDAVEAGLDLPDSALSASRATLAQYGNMSSSTLMFTLASLMAIKPANGLALAFGPGLAVEGLRFGWIDA